MKKINIFSLAIAISFSLSFSSLISGCEDVPAPYEVNIDDNGGGTGTTLTGDGSVTSPYTVADIKTLLDANTLSSTTYAFVQGRVSQFDSLSLSYGNAYYNISADGLASGTQLIVYRGYYTAGSKFTSDSQALSAGDSVVVYGTFQIYSSKYEINQGSKIAYLNGTSYDVVTVSNTVTGEQKGSGTLADPYNPSKALAVIASGSIPSDSVYVKGIVSNITSLDTSSYGNAEYYLSEDGKTTGDQLLVYRGYGLGGAKFTSTSDLVVGDTLIIKGQLTNYNGTYEVTKGSQIVSRNGKTASSSSTSSDTGTSQIKSDAAQITIADFLSKADTVVTYQLTGVVDSIVNATYGNFYLADATGSVYVYGLLTSTGVSKQFSSLNIAKGDTVTLQGVYCEYNGTPEIKNAIFVSVKNAGSTTSTPTTGDETIETPTGDNLLSNGGFESWTDGRPDNWKTSSTAGNATISQSTDAHTGSYSVQVTGTTSANKRFAYKEATYAAGSYVMTFYVKAVDSNCSVRPGYATFNADGTINSSGYKYGDYANDITKDEWREVTLEFTLEADAQICPLMMVSKNPGTAALVDDFSLIKK